MPERPSAKNPVELLQVFKSELSGHSIPGRNPVIEQLAGTIPENLSKACFRAQPGRVFKLSAKLMGVPLKRFGKVGPIKTQNGICVHGFDGPDELPAWRQGPILAVVASNRLFRPPAQHFYGDLRRQRVNYYFLARLVGKQFGAYFCASPCTPGMLQVPRKREVLTVILPRLGEMLANCCRVLACKSIVTPSEGSPSIQ